MGRVRVAAVGATEWRTVEVAGLRQWLDAQPDQPWALKLECDGSWSPVVRYDPAVQTTADVRFALVAAGRVGGRLAAAKGQSIVPPARVRFDPAELLAQGVEQTVAEECPVVEDRWECLLPPGFLDLQVSVAGFAPLFYWGVEVSPGETTTLATRQLARGASVAGRVELDDRRKSLVAATVDLTPSYRGWIRDPREAERQSFRGRRVAPDEDGVFEMVAVPPGSYRLVVEADGFSPAAIELSLVDGEAVVLPSMRLQPLAELEVFVDPPVGPMGEPWRLVLQRVDDESLLLETVVESGVELSGYWHARELPAGRYELAVRDSEGSFWVNTEITVEPGDAPLELEVPIVPLDGRILAGDDPVETEIVFGTTRRRPRIAFRSDEQGRFDGFLPYEGAWPVELVDPGRQVREVEPVEVRLGPSGIARVRLELPDTVVRGLVVEHGEPVRDAIVLVIADGEGGRQRRAATDRAGDDGRFAVHNVLPGRLRLRAESSSGRRSRWHEVHVREGVESPEVVLEVEDRIGVEGFVLSDVGGVPGAHLSVFGVRLGRILSEEQVTSGVEGHFRVEIDADAEAIDVLALAPGRPAAMMRFPVARGSTTTAVVNLAGTGGSLEILPQPGFRLHHGGASLPVNSVLSRFSVTGRLGSGTEGLLLRDLAPGPYSLCGPGSARCSSGSLEPGGTLRLGTGRERDAKGGQGFEPR